MTQLGQKVQISKSKQRMNYFNSPVTLCISIHTYNESIAAPAGTPYLLPPLLFAFVLGGLQHLLLPQVEEVGGVCVELQSVLFVIPE